MEDVLEVYHTPYEQNYPMICMDEKPIQMVRQTRQSIPMKPGAVERCDYQYDRAGVANAFIFCEPLAGQRMDQLNTHNIGSLYKAFPPEVAQRLAKRLEIHHTPKHGSWLNIAEIELSCMTKQCLKDYIPDIQTLSSQTSAWFKQRNQDAAIVNWQFSTDNARIRLKRLYPVFGD